MHWAALFLVSAFAMVVRGAPSARTFGSSHHLQHGAATHHHAAHQHHVFPGAQHQTADHGHQVLVEDDASVSVLVCQVVKVPIGPSGAQPAQPSNSLPAANVAGSPPVAPSSVISASQDALSDLKSRVRTAVDQLVDPVVTVLQNASLWLNRTSQLHLHQSHQHSAHHAHLHQHGGQAHHHAIQSHHGGQVNNHAAPEQGPNHQVHPIHVHGTPQRIPKPAVPMTVVSVPVLVPAVHAGSFPLVNLSAVVPAGVDDVALPLSDPGSDNATSSFTVAADSVATTTHPASTPANSGLVGRTGALPTTPGTDAPVTPVSQVSTSATGSDTITIWFRSGGLQNTTESSSATAPTTSQRQRQSFRRPQPQRSCCSQATHLPS
ncbi:uncharacterized protein LOC142584416 [Dermacentor variabilis]|uniref:uncharacterized protein LOC142584416 n=1 Tax=Dermacentor variabilis TaxID=34621 RepID=UPI003F5C72DC